MTPTTTRHSDWKDGFLFLANNLALDFLNTRPFIDGTPRELLPDFPALLRWFRAANLLDRATAARLEKKYAAASAARLALDDLLKFREDFREQIQRWEKRETLHAAALTRLNHLLATHPLPTRLTPSGKTLELSDAFHPQTPNDLFAPIVQAAATLLAHADRARIRQCDNCVLHFLDTSKKGTRRWCSMQLCGNRLKVAAYHARQQTH
jgi:predicted RNA-binding Zn ribbon-like protein